MHAGMLSKCNYDEYLNKSYTGVVHFPKFIVERKFSEIDGHGITVDEWKLLEKFTVINLRIGDGLIDGT